MSEMTARIRDRMMDGVIGWQERLGRHDDFRQQHSDIHRSRMSCSASLPSFHQTQDWTGSIPVSSCTPVIETAKPRTALISREGIRWNAAVTALVLVAVLAAGILLGDLSSIGIGTRTITKLSSGIADMQDRNQRLQAEIEMSTDTASVCTEAVKLNLISSGGAKTIRLTAPVNAQLTLSSAAKAAENADLEGRMTSFAGD